MKQKFLLLTLSITFFNLIIFGQIQIDIPAPESNQINSTVSQKSDFRKEPYLLFEGINTQMRFLWQLSISDTCEIFWGTDSTCSLGNTITQEYGIDHQHSYTITGLTTGTKYHYQVVYNVDTIRASFFTAPAGNEENIKFFVYGDTRSDIVNHDLNSQLMIGDYQADSSYQSLTLFTGDHVDYGADESSWDNTFFTHNAPNVRKRMAEVPFVPCLGNHEMYQQNFNIDHSTSVFGKYFPFPYEERRYWSFDYGPMHVAILDQYPDYYQLLPLEGYLDTAQLLWLKEDLANTTKPWKVIVLHEPGWSCEGSSSTYAHPNNPDVQDSLQPILEEYGVQIVFAAHNHYYARACKNGIYHITTAGGGAPLYEIEEEFPNVMNTFKVHHYCKVAIEDDTMTVTAVKPNGEVIDEFQINQNNRPEHLLGFLDKDSVLGNISDVNISGSGQSTNPDSVGYYGLELATGFQDVLFQLEGYYPIEKNIEIIEGTETQLDDTLIAISGGIDDPFNNEAQNTEQIIISPNPATEYVNITANISSHPIELYIYNPIGICIQKERFATGSRELVLKMSDYTSGIYFITLQSGSGRVTKKLVIN
ncbi:MAG: metallophosphoesterase [Bacteroidales bacterium]|nr:metallophosphoesterase [Bacteroidales bacterium]MCF8454279.1 metallophosphoesterase [Bacteroidales bacterium]